MSGAFSSRVYVGRERGLRELQGALERAWGGAAAALLVGGEAGVGKTRLLDELTARAEGDGAVVLTRRGADLREAAMPLLPIAEALASLGPLPAAAGVEEARHG